jgi:hypothetical protein
MCDFEPVELYRTENIIFAEEERKPKTSVFGIYSAHDGAHLAEIRWHGPWRQYVLSPFDETLWSDGCLGDVIKFMLELRQKRKDAKAGGCNP